MGKSMDQYMQIIENAHTKTASAPASAISNELLSKLANELSGAASSAAEAVAGAKPADSTVAAASPVVVAATEAASATQLALAGANPAESAAGMVPAPAKPNEGVVVTDADGKVTTSNALHKSPMAAAVAAEPTSKTDTVEKTSELRQAEEIGATMARSYVAEIEKIAKDREYNEALDYLQSRNLLEGYTINK